MDADAERLAAWLAREFGNPELLPLERQELEAIARIGRITRHRRDSFLFHQGEPADRAYLIRRGRVSLWRDHRPPAQLARIGPGMMVGDAELFEAGAYFCSAQASEETTALSFERGIVIAMLAEHPRVALRWLVVALEQADLLQRRLAQVLRRSLKGRVADLLLAELTPSGDVRLSHESIATLLGASRPAVTRVLAELRREGVVRTRRGSLTVTDETELRRALEP